MFDQLKQLKNLSRLRSILKKQRETIQEEGIEITIDGNLEVENIRLNTKLSKEKQEEILKQIFNKAVKRIQKDVAQEISQLG